MDDPNYLGVTVQILKTPWSPFSGTPLWTGEDWFEANANPPLWSYLYAGVVAIFGWDELALHAVQVVAFAVFIFGTYALARRMSDWPVFWTAAVSVGPFLLPGVNLMLDLPMLALWVWTLEFALRGWEQPDSNVIWALLAGMTSAAAVLTKYTSCLLLILFVFGAWRTGRWRTLVALVPPVIALAAWCLHNQYYYGRLHLFAHGGDVNWSQLPQRIAILLRYVGGVFWLTPLWLAVFMRRSPFHRVLGVFLVPLALWAGWFDAKQAATHLATEEQQVDWLYQAHFIVFSANGVLAMAAGCWIALFPKAESNQVNTRHVVQLWFLLALLFVLLAVPTASFGAIRHFAPFLLPLVLLCAHPVETVYRSPPLWPTLKFGCWAVTIALGVALAHADLTTAQVYKKAAESIVSELRMQGQVWIVGDPDFRYYAQSQGAHAWGDEQQQPQSGDFVVIPYLQGMYRLDPGFLSTCIGSGVLEFPSATPLRTVGLVCNYYGGATASLPWKLSVGVMRIPGEEPYLSQLPIEEFYVYRIP